MGAHPVPKAKEQGAKPSPALWVLSSPSVLHTEEETPRGSIMQRKINRKTSFKTSAPHYESCGALNIQSLVTKLEKTNPDFKSNVEIAGVIFSVSAFHREICKPQDIK